MALAGRVIPLRPAPQARDTTGLVGAATPLGLYVHFPWCVRKCPYCDFNSHEARGQWPEDEYLRALIADLEQALPQVWGRRVSSVFVGGGTPSLMQPNTVDALLTAIRARVALLPDAEITLEANPGTVEAARFDGYRAAGVNRVSIGIQSFDGRHLAALGRIHDESEARVAVEAGLKTFDNVNLDLMVALPGQTLADARRDAEIAVGYSPAQISAYQLTLEPNTPFHRAPPLLPDPDLAADMQDMVEEILARHGYRHYETSAFARPGRECLHNLNYWQFGDYLGIGAGAHSKLTFSGRIVREVRRPHPREYLAGAGAGSFAQDRQEVPVERLPFEFMMNALRLNDGFHPRLFSERTGLSVETIRPQLEQAERRGLLAVSPERIAPMPLGRRFLNDLLQVFLDS